MINSNSNFNREIQQSELDLPKMVQDVVKHFDTPLQKKMALVSTLTIVGSLIPQVTFNYQDGLHYPSLYTVIVLPPASGKGSTGKLEKVLKRINDEQLLEIQSRRAKYNKEYRDYLKAEKKGENVKPPVKPSYPLLKIPGNITSAKFIEQLADNDGKMFVLIFESEIDALTNMMGNSKFGKDNSLILRKAYHNESVSLMRKGGDHFDIGSPKLSIVLTGTPSQLSKLFESVEDGLFSRFLIVHADVPVVWKDVQPCDTCDPIEVKLEKLSYDFFSFYQRMKDQKVEFKMTDAQWTQINQFGEDRLKSSLEEGGEYATSIAKRHAVMIARIACILSMVRYGEVDRQESIWYCEDRDFSTALSIVSESYESSLEVFERLRKQKSENGASRTEEFFDRLPMKFKRKELAPLMKSMRISDRTIDRYLSELVISKQLRSPSKGYYEKNDVADLADGKFYSPNAPLE
jgi:Protein of unknown function (DUF3987)